MSPKGATGALCHSGSRARFASRKATRRGQSGQSRSGTRVGAWWLDRAASLLEVVIAPRRHRGRALEELRSVVARLALAAIARGRALGRVAAKLGLQLDEIGEDVGLAAQLVGDHRRLAGDRGHDSDADAAALHGFDQRAEI